MIWIFAIFMICCFVTLWFMLSILDSNDMTLHEFFTGVDIKGAWQDDIIKLRKEINKQEERISRLESTLYIAEVLNDGSK